MILKKLWRLCRDHSLQNFRSDDREASHLLPVVDRNDKDAIQQRLNPEFKRQIRPEYPSEIHAPYQSLTRFATSMRIGMAVGRASAAISKISRSMSAGTRGLDGGGSIALA
jgi:hypothetical protein